MNIFVLSKNPKIAAKYHCDKHVVKMILETKQILDAASSKSGKNKSGKQLAWFNHPCSIWARTSRQNYIWLINLGKELCIEYTYRYNKVHKYEQSFYKIKIPKFIPDIGLTKFALAMPTDCKCNTAVKSYRLYYCKYKNHIASWKNRPIPKWYLSGTKN